MRRDDVYLKFWRCRRQEKDGRFVILGAILSFARSSFRRGEERKCLLVQDLTINAALQDPYEQLPMRAFAAKPELRPRTMGQAFDEFVNTTTLIGIPHILRKKSVVWLLAYIACMSLSIYQSWQSAHTYIEQVSHQSVSIKSAQSLPWPSITVCNNVVIRSAFLNNVTVPGYRNISGLTCDQLRNESLVNELRQTNIEKVAEYVRRNLTKEERWNKSLSREDWVKECTFSYEACNFTDTDKFYEFNSPFDGSCITFNPALVPNTDIKQDLDTKLILKFNRQGTGYQLSGRKPYVSLLIHSPGTTPVMDLPEVIDVFDRQFVNLGLRLVQKDFMLKARKVVPTCVVDDASGDEFREKNLYYNRNSTPYRYSLEACMKSCVQKQVFTPCNFLDATFNTVQNETIEKTFNLQIPPAAACNKTEKVEVGMDECKCPFPCSYYQYLYTIDTTPLTEKSKHKHCNNTDDDDEEKHVSSMKVAILFMSNIFDHNEEVLDYDLTQFLGFLGGNVSLWLGLCVLSLLEVVELVWELIAITCRNTLSRNEVPRRYPTYNKLPHHVPIAYASGGFSISAGSNRKSVKPMPP